MTTTFKNGLGKYDTGFYYYCFRLDGRQFRGNTQTKDLVLARKVLAQRKEEARQTLARDSESLGLNQSLKDSPSPIEVPTISELVKEWTETHSSVVSDSHLRSIEQVARIWLLPTFGDKPIDQIGTPEVLALRTRILNAKRSPATANHIGRVVKLLWNFAVTTGKLEQVPFKLKPLRIQKKPRPFITAERVPEFLAMVDERVKNHQVRVILRVMLGLGMRASEVLGMRWEGQAEGHAITPRQQHKGAHRRLAAQAQAVFTSIKPPPGSSGSMASSVGMRIKGRQECERLIRLPWEVGLHLSSKRRQ